MKKNFIIKIIVIIAVIIVIFFVGTGFIKRTDVFLADFYVSEDGKEITLKTGISSSMGYVRGFKDEGGGVKPHKLIFYSAFGGLNGSIGAEDTFTLEVAPDDTEIYFNRLKKGYELILVKNESTGQWERPRKTEISEGNFVNVKNVILDGNTKDLSLEDSFSLCKMIENKSWNTEGTADCFSNLQIEIDGDIFMYHSDCGTFNDNFGKRSLSLDEDEKNTLNGILKKYVSLTSEEVPEY